MTNQNVWDEIKNKSDIVSIISEYVSLSKQGNNFKACCPFHGEKTPSFIVSPDKQIFKCFGCDKGGNVLDFVSEYKKITKLEALKILAEKANTNIDDYISKYQNSNYSESQMKLFDINDQTNNFFQYQLITSKDEKLKEYLDSRGLTREIIKKFEIGYAPKDINILEYLKNREVEENLVLKASLILPNDSNFFNDRITFPLKDEKGNIVGFSARDITNLDNVKYLNSPETDVFKKSKILFNYFNALESIDETKEVYIVEGQMDVIALAKANIFNAVATMGTALTYEHLKLLKNKTITLAFDNDKAGQNALKKNLNLILEHKNEFNLNVSIISNYPEKINDVKDIDELFNKYQQNGINKLINSKQTLSQFIKKNYFDKTKIETLSIEEKSKHFDKAFKLVNSLSKSEALLFKEDIVKSNILTQETYNHFNHNETTLNSNTFQKESNQEVKHNEPNLNNDINDKQIDSPIKKTTKKIETLSIRPLKRESKDSELIIQYQIINQKPILMNIQQNYKTQKDMKLLAKTADWFKLNFSKWYKGQKKLKKATMNFTDSPLNENLIDETPTIKEQKILNQTNIKGEQEKMGNRIIGETGDGKKVFIAVSRHIDIDTDEEIFDDTLDEEEILMIKDPLKKTSSEANDEKQSNQNQEIKTNQETDITKLSVDELVKQANQELENYLIDPIKMQKLLDFTLSIQNKYSSLNMILLQKQFEGLTQVKSFTDWSTKEKVSINKGSKALKILAPIKDIICQLPDGKWTMYKNLSNEDKAKIKTGEIKTKEKIHGYKIANVFDISQTNMPKEKYPKNYFLTFIEEDKENLEQNKKLFDSLKEAISKSGIKIYEGQAMGQVKGCSSTQYKEINLNTLNSTKQNIKTLLHEYAHLKLNHSYEAMSRPECEYQAEMTAYACAKKLGVDTKEYSFDYINNWLLQSTIKDKQHLVDGVLKTSREILKEVETNFFEQKQTLTQTNQESEQNFRETKKYKLTF